jgi:hypothetical protein
VLIELNPDYITLARGRIDDDQVKRAAKPLDSRRAPVLTCYNDQPTGAKMPTLITFATDNPEDAKRIMEALYGAPAQEALPLPATPARSRCCRRLIRLDGGDHRHAAAAPLRPAHATGAGAAAHASPPPGGRCRRGSCC